MTRIKLLDHDLELLPDGAALWLETKTLLVADLHLGKAQTFQTFGLPVPSGAEIRDLERLADVVKKTAAKRVIILGDLLHSRVGLRDALVATIASSLQSLGAEVSLVSGNHDAALERVARLADLPIHDSLEELGVRLIHKPLERGPFIAGHVHPSATLRLEGDMIKLPCFVLEGGGLTLPAFSSFAAGANVPRRAGRQRFVIADSEVVAIDADEPEV